MDIQQTIEERIKNLEERVSKLEKKEQIDKVQYHGDMLLNTAIEMIRNHHGTVSTSLLQRKLSIGYARAARLLDQLEEKGITSAPNSLGRRKILKRKDNL